MGYRFLGPEWVNSLKIAPPKAAARSAEQSGQEKKPISATMMTTAGRCRISPA